MQTMLWIAFDNHDINKLTDIGSSTAPRCIIDGNALDKNPTGNPITQQEGTVAVLSHKD